MQKVNCAVVGLGWMGRIRVAALHASGAARIVACCDLDPETAAGLPEGVRFSTDAIETVTSGDVDAVFVSTPDGRHREPVIAALRAGKHVFCEKPVATTLADADAMVAADPGGRLVVGHSLRADSRYLAVRAATDALGPAVHTVTRRNWPASEGRRQQGQTSLALYLAVHDFDVLQWIVGSPIVEVSGVASRTPVPGLDEGGAHSIVATLRFANGCVGAHETSWALPDQAGLDQGDHALSYVGVNGNAYLTERDHGVVVHGDAAQFPDALNGEVFGVQTGMYVNEVERFLATVREGRPPLVTGEEARGALAAALALEESLRTGRPAGVAA
ncbi:Gfo/Idh/MocA family protein [Nonomuraea sp. NPDC050540]|uniref:Gfo/Idh/MocA family protein n=1 Tax=Nonomuraea sp. NPDC050540 TaxID=3364367 RepID=UPI0037986430